MKATTLNSPPQGQRRVELEHPTNQVSPSPTKSLPLGGARGFLVVFREGVRSVRRIGEAAPETVGFLEAVLPQRFELLVASLDQEK